MQLIPGRPGPVKVNQTRRFLSTLVERDGHGILVRQYTNQPVRVIELRAKEYDETERLWLVRAEDGVEFSAWESELTEGGSNVYVTPDGTYEDNPEWSI